MAAAGDQELSKFEAQLYDRSIRLWGVEAQKKSLFPYCRLRRTKLLLIGFQSLHAEICKNVILVGVQSITIVDEGLVQPQDLSAHLFLGAENIGKPVNLPSHKRAAASLAAVQELNPLVQVTLATEATEDLVKQHSLVCAEGCSMEQQVALPNIRFRMTASAEASIFLSSLATLWGCNSNLNHSVKKEMVKGELVSVTRPGVAHFVPLQQAFAQPWANLSPRRFPLPYFALQRTRLLTTVLWRYESLHGRRPSADDLEEVQRVAKTLDTEQKTKIFSTYPDLPEKLTRFCTGAISPVSSVVGGFLGQELIKVASGREAPLNNFFLFSAEDGRVLVETLSG